MSLNGFDQEWRDTIGVKGYPMHPHAIFNGESMIQHEILRNPIIRHPRQALSIPICWTQSSHALWVKSSTKALTTWWNSTQTSHLAFHYFTLETIWRPFGGPWPSLTIFDLYPHTIVLLEGQCLMRAGHTPRLNSRDLIAMYAPQHRNSWSTSAKLPNIWRQGPRSGKGTSYQSSCHIMSY